MEHKRTFESSRLRLVKKGLLPKARKPARWAIALGWFFIGSALVLAIALCLFAIAFAVDGVRAIIELFQV